MNTRCIAGWDRAWARAQSWLATLPQATFSSPSVFDPESTVAPLFGARGTPAAVLVDRHGRIASTVAIGKDAVLSLLVPLPAGLPIR